MWCEGKKSPEFLGLSWSKAPYRNHETWCGVTAWGWSLEPSGLQGGWDKWCKRLVCTDPGNCENSWFLLVSQAIAHHTSLLTKTTDSILPPNVGLVSVFPTSTKEDGKCGRCWELRFPILRRVLWPHSAFAEMHPISECLGLCWRCRDIEHSRHRWLCLTHE